MRRHRTPGEDLSTKLVELGRFHGPARITFTRPDGKEVHLKAVCTDIQYDADIDRVCLHPGGPVVAAYKTAERYVGKFTFLADVTTRTREEHKMKQAWGVVIWRQTTKDGVQDRELVWESQESIVSKSRFAAKVRGYLAYCKTVTVPDKPIDIEEVTIEAAPFVDGE